MFQKVSSDTDLDAKVLEVKGIEKMFVHQFTSMSSHTDNTRLLRKDYVFFLFNAN